MKELAQDSLVQQMQKDLQLSEADARNLLSVLVSIAKGQESTDLQLVCDVFGIGGVQGEALIKELLSQVQNQVGSILGNEGDAKSQTGTTPILKQRIPIEISPYPEGFEAQPRVDKDRIVRYDPLCISNVEIQEATLAGFLSQWPLDTSQIGRLAGDTIIPPGFDGPCPVILPKVRSLGEALGLSDPYGEENWKIADYLAQKLGFDVRFNVLQTWKKVGCGTGWFLRPDVLIAAELAALEEMTPGDFLVLPVSSGGLYAGYCPLEAKRQALTDGYLPLGVVHTMIFLRLCSARMSFENSPGIDCVADIHRWTEGSNFVGCPNFRYKENRIEYHASTVTRAWGNFGIIVGLPKVA